MVDFELIESLPFTTSRVVGATARIGLVVLASDYTIENEFRRFFVQPGVDVFHARIANAPNIDPDTLAAMGPSITETASRLLPGDRLDVLAYGCTSASFVLGPDVVDAMLLDAKPEAKVTNPASAAFAALNALGATKVAVLTPYRSDVNAFVRRGIEAGGFHVPIFGSFNEQMDPIVADIDEASLRSAILTLVAKADVDAVFVSCTSIRMAHMIDRLEKETDLSVTSSNHAMAWHCMRLAGLTEKVEGYGRLFNLGFSP